MKTFTFTAIIESDKDGSYAYCPQLKGCQSQGDTVEEAVSNLRQAAHLYIETLAPEELESLTANRTILFTSLGVPWRLTEESDG